MRPALFPMACSKRRDKTRFEREGNNRRRYSASSSPVSTPLMRCLRIADGLDTMTRRGEIGTSLPVFGLRPMRWPFLRTTKEPNDDNLTVSPRSRQSVISLSTSSTSVADSVRDKPTFWYTASHKSARVIVFLAIASPTLGARYHRSTYRTELSRILGSAQRVNGLREVWHYHRSSAAPQVKPPPIASSKSKSPRLIRRSATASASASGIEAAEVLPCLSTVLTILVGAMPSLWADPSIMRLLAWCGINQSMSATVH